MIFSKSGSLPPSIKNYSANLLAQFIGRLISIGSQLLVFLYVARNLGAVEFGKFAYFLTFVNVLSVISGFGTGETSSKDLGKLPEAVRPKYWGNVLIVRTIFNITVFLLGAAIATVLRKDMQSELIIGAACVPFTSTRIFDPIFQVYNRPSYSSLSSGIYGISYFAFSMVVLFILRPSILHLALAYLAANIVYVILAYCLALRLVKPIFSPDKNHMKRLLKIAAPIGASSIFTIINSRADTFMLAWLKNDREVGLYNAAYKIVDLTVLGMVLLTNPLIPLFSKKASEDINTFTRTGKSIIEVMFLILPPVAIFTPRFSGQIMTFLYGPEFIESAKALNILVWVCVLVCFSLFSLVLCLSIDLVHFGWWNSALAAAINITLNYVWIPKYGFVGSCWATLICEVVLLGITAFYLLKNLPNLLSMSFVSKYLIFMSIWVIANFFLSKNMVWYGAMFISLLVYVFGVVIVFYRHRINFSRISCR